MTPRTVYARGSSLRSKGREKTRIVMMFIDSIVGGCWFGGFLELGCYIILFLIF